MMSDFSGVSNVSLGESAYEVAQGKLGLETGRSVSYSDRLVGGEFSAYRQNSASKDWEWGFSGRNKNGKQYHATGTVKFSGVFGAEQLREGSLVKKQILEAKRQSEGGVGAVPGFEIRYSDQEVFKAGTQPSLSHRVGVWLENQGAQAVQHRLGGKTLTISNDEQGGRLWAAAEASGQLGLKGGPLALPAGASARFKGGYDKQKKALEGSAMAERGLAALGVVSEILNALAMTPKRSANRTAIRPPRVVGRTGVGTNAPPTRVVKGVVPQMPGGQMITPHEQIVLRTPAKMLGQKKVKKSVPVLGAQQVITARLQEQLSRLGIKCDDPQQVKLGREIYVIGTEKQTKKTFQVKVNADGSLNRQSATTAGSRQISLDPPDEQFTPPSRQLAPPKQLISAISVPLPNRNDIPLLNAMGEVGKELGRGNMGVVYRHPTDRDLAIKIPLQGSVTNRQIIVPAHMKSVVSDPAKLTPDEYANREVNYMSWLLQAGFPVAKQRLVRVGVNGPIGIEMPRFHNAIFSKDELTPKYMEFKKLSWEGLIKNHGQSILKQLEGIRSKQKELGIDIHDLQFVITDKGKVVILDPIGVHDSANGKFVRAFDRTDFDRWIEYEIKPSIEAVNNGRKPTVPDYYNRWTDYDQ
jgi:hypothetical protein